MRPLKITTVDFDKPITIMAWTHDMELCQVPVQRGLLIMARSTRFDTEHTTANVRVLSDTDRVPINEEFGMDIPENFPVTFRQ
jgi:hypothetical protein